ncbi:MAG: tetratricopeptide repeat protein [Chloroflexi bacterium]|nr:tetratricopeptide repeat protein [Chloroflexota bacterium]
MVNFPSDEKARLRRQKAKEAIVLAMQSRWEEAVLVNQSILEVAPTDVDAYNRLGKALMELGRRDEALEAYQKAVKLDPYNGIASKNLERLSVQMPAPPAHGVGRERRQVSPELFIEETGKTGVTDLLQLGPKEHWLDLVAGDEVKLKAEGQNLVVATASGDYIGQVEPKLGLRLVRLMEGGNLYAAAIASLNESSVRVVIRETFQDPSQVGRPSFPSRAHDGFAPYMKERPIRYELGEEGDEDEEAGYTIEGGEELSAPRRSGAEEEGEPPEEE